MLTLALILAVVLVLAAAAYIPFIRRKLVTDRVLALYRRILPDMSQTEKEAIDAGTVWWDGDLFSGRPDFDKLLAVPEPRLSPEEQAFLDGPDEQKNHYLPRLAKGLEVPCFALTNPEAGSDAASIPDTAVVCRGMWQGKEVLGMRVTWDKRYITLGPVATLLGLAFRLYDPDRLLGSQTDLGITCALVPTSTPGVNIGRRHLPLNAVFQNGPNSGKDVFMPLDWIIGGPEYAGKGWMMLMACLAAGRSISLPTSSVGGVKALTRFTGAYARVRAQFKTPIGKLEGVEEALGRIAAHCYMMDATRIMTAGAVDLGEKPAVLSAIAKYHMTERARLCVNDAMDIHGGKGICLGPNNWIGRGYQMTPIAITVEGANILTRTLKIGRAHV